MTRAELRLVEFGKGERSLGDLSHSMAFGLPTQYALQIVESGVPQPLDVERLQTVWNTRGVSSLYSPAVLDHFKNPRNAGDLPDATAEVEVTNPACGDIMRLSVRLEDGQIAEARFKTRGCVTAIACGSLLTEMLQGKSLEAVRTITPETISDALGGLPPATFHGSQLACDALAALLAKGG